MKRLYSKEQHKYEYQGLKQAIQSLEGTLVVWEYSQTKDAQTLYAMLQA